MTVNRSKKVFINTICGILYELVALVCGLILPRLILENFGSSYNGITSSITQFISCISLMKAGIGGATKAALYKPLAENDTKSISAIINQTVKFMRKIALFFVLFILLFAIIYPLYINDDFEWLFTSTLIIIISMSTFAQYYFGISYDMLLAADMKQHVSAIFNIFMTIMNTVICVILIRANCGIHLVKLGSSIVYFIGPIFLCFYTKKKYKIDTSQVSSTDLIKARWDALGHEIANFVNTNSAIMILTIFSTLLNVSIYTVYNYIIINVRKTLLTFVTGFGSAFGNMYAKKEYKLMNENLGIYELIMFSLVAIIYPVMLLLIVPFVRIYTDGINDANYIQPMFAILSVLAGAFNCIRLPYQTIVTAAGDFKGTRNGAFVEAALNLFLSILFVIKFGLIGVAIGTFVATFFRTIQYVVYISNHIIYRNIKFFVKKILIFSVYFIVISLILWKVVFSINNWLSWILAGFCITMISFAIVMLLNIIFFKEDFNLLMKKTLLKRSKNA